MGRHSRNSTSDEKTNRIALELIRNGELEAAGKLLRHTSPENRAAITNRIQAARGKATRDRKLRKSIPSQSLDINLA